MAATSFCFDGPIVYFLAQDVSELFYKRTMLLPPVLKSSFSEYGALFPFRGKSRASALRSPPVTLCPRNCLE